MLTAFPRLRLCSPQDIISEGFAKARTESTLTPKQEEAIKEENKQAFRELRELTEGPLARAAKASKSQTESARLKELAGEHALNLAGVFRTLAGQYGQEEVRPGMRCGEAKEELRNWNLGR